MIWCCDKCINRLNIVKTYMQYAFINVNHNVNYTRLKSTSINVKSSLWRNDQDRVYATINIFCIIIIVRFFFKKITFNLITKLFERKSFSILNQLMHTIWKFTFKVTFDFTLWTLLYFYDCISRLNVYSINY